MYKNVYISAVKKNTCERNRTKDPARQSAGAGKSTLKKILNRNPGGGSCLLFLCRHGIIG
jgi:hypothetical protein